MYVDGKDTSALVLFGFGGAKNKQIANFLARQAARFDNGFHDVTVDVVPYKDTWAGRFDTVLNTLGRRGTPESRVSDVTAVFNDMPVGAQISFNGTGEDH